MIQNLKKDKIWKNSESIFFDHGRGNNWAMSYTQKPIEPKKRDKKKKQDFILFDLKKFDVAEENKEIIEKTLEFVISHNIC